jgi:rhodanese-related sulfurtransferase
MVIRLSCKDLLVFGWMLALAMPISSSEHTKDSIETIKKNLANQSAILLDVRETAEWKEGHLKDAKHLPLSTIRNHLTKESLSKLMGKATIVYCHCAAGVRSLKAADALRKLGVDVRPLRQGFDQLLESGFAKAP